MTMLDLGDLDLKSPRTVIRNQLEMVCVCLNLSLYHLVHAELTYLIDLVNLTQDASGCSS